MARFIVAVLQSDGEFELTDTRVSELIPCDDVSAVQAAIDKAGSLNDQDWNVFELVDGKYVSRAVIRNLDRTIKELS